jgi:hypothetical protein
MFATPEAVVSNDMRALVHAMLSDIRAQPPSTLLQAKILVPDQALRVWLCHEAASYGISLLRLEVQLLDEWLEEPLHSQQVVTKASLFPLLLSFLKYLHCNAVPSDQAIDTSENRLRTAHRLCLPFALRVFLDERAWFHNHAEAEPLWEQFVAWSPLAIPSLLPPEEVPSVVPLYAFGFSSLHPFLLRKLKHIRSFRGLYLLSPCMLFWGDQSSDDEARFLLKSADACGASRASTEQLEQFLVDRHQLLANSGLVGREFLRVLENSSLQTRSCYVFPQPLLHPPYTDVLLPDVCISSSQSACTLMDYLKADLLLLVGKRDDPHALPHDDSLQIHGAPTVLREVEALRDRIATLGLLQPGSVVVLATDLERYVSAIDHVFGDSLPVQIWGREPLSSATSAVRMFVSLLLSKGSKHEWVQWLRHPLCQRALALTPKEAQDVIDWISKRPIQWGLSRAHRERYLVSRGIVSTPHERDSTFASERERLLDALVQISGHDTVDGEASLLGPLGRFFDLLAKIEGWTTLPIDPHSAVPMAEASGLFMNMLQFLLGDEPRGFEEEALLSAATECSALASVTGSPAVPWIETIHLFFQLVARYHRKTDRAMPCPIIVGEFGSFQPFPAALVAILGAHEGSLPKKSDDRLFDRLDRIVPGVPQSNTFLDRYSFLEALLSAQNLFIGYQSFAFETRERLSPSPIVTDLVSHLDANYRIDGSLPSISLVTEHPLYRPRRAAHGQKTAAPQYKTLARDNHTINILQLVRAARSPLDLFYAEQLALRRQKRYEESLFVPPWTIAARVEAELVLIPESSDPSDASKPRASIDRRLGQYSNIDQSAIVERLELSRSRGDRNFRELALGCPAKGAETKSVRCTLSSKVHKRLQQLLPCSPCRFDVHMLPTVVAPHMTENAIFIPSLSGSHQVVGTWNGLINQGMIIVSEQWEKELFSRWPECALRSYLASLGMPIERQAIIVQKDAVVPLPEVDAMNDWIDFAHCAATNPFPYTFDIVKLLMDQPKPEVLFTALCKKAQEEKEPGIWSVFAHTMTLEQCAERLPLFERYAVRLWSSLFSLLEGYEL